MNVKTRAGLTLTATTHLDVPASLHAVKAAAGRVKGGGTSLLTTGLQNLGAQIQVERETPSALTLSLTSGRRLVELCTFTAVAAQAGDVTTLRVGGLQTYRTTQSTVLGFIPVGPKMIAGMAPYKKFLAELDDELRRADPGADVTIAERS